MEKEQAKRTQKNYLDLQTQAERIRICRKEWPIHPKMQRHRGRSVPIQNTST